MKKIKINWDNLRPSIQTPAERTPEHEERVRKIVEIAELQIRARKAINASFHRDTQEAISNTDSDTES